MERLKLLDERFHARPIVGAQTIRADVETAWVHPCLTHFARVFRVPSGESLEALTELWQRGLGASLSASTGALYARAGRVYFLIPPEDAAPLSASQRRALAPWICADGDARCGHAGSYVTRAEQAFDVAESLALSRSGGLLRDYGNDDPMPGGITNFANRDHPCYPPAAQGEDDVVASRTSFEAVAICAASEAPRTFRYPRGVHLRGPERGWLMLRGRRGHYVFADEVRAYDLATGAAYVARSESGLVLNGPSVDFDAVDKQRKPSVFTGSVVIDQVRELAFVLATGSAVRPERREIQVVPIRDELPITFTAGRGAAAPFDVPEAKWWMSSQTSIAYELVDDGVILASGSLTWPDSWQAVESYADRLVEVLEAGLVRGCAPARLPPGMARGRQGAIHPIDADPRAQADVFETMASALDGLGKNVCPTAKR